MHRGRHPGDTREEAGGRYLPHGRRPRTAGQPASARQGSLLLSTFNESRAELVSDVHLFLPPLRFLNLGGFEARVIVSFPSVMAASLVPSDGADCLDRLGKNFQLAEEVVGALSKAGIANLEEFRFFFDAEAKVEPWLGKIQLGAEAQIQAARLRRAWHAVSLYYKTAEQDRSRVAIEDLDSLLGDTELRSAKEAFWVRYKLRFPTEVYPSDAAVSRASREMSKRLLCVTSHSLLTSRGNETDLQKV